MSNLIDFDDDDFFAKGESSITPAKDLDEIFGTSKQTESDNLDDLFGSKPDKKKPLSEEQMDDLFGKAEDDKFDFFARGDGSVPDAKDEKQGSAKPPMGFDDSFAMLVQSNIAQSGSGEKSHNLSDAKTPDLDFLLEAQPSGMLDSTDDLMMFDPFSELPKKPKSPVPNPKVKKSTELKIDPSDEFFADPPLSPRLIQPEPSQPPSETGSKMEAGSHGQNAGGMKQKRSMERSFEDLLHGLSDESDLDIDDLVSHDTDYSTNLESILPSPAKSQPSEDTDKELTTPSKHFEPPNTLDLLTSTPNTASSEGKGTEDLEDEAEDEIPAVRVETPEGVVSSPDADIEEKEFEEEDTEDDDMKAWEMVSKDDIEEQDEMIDEAIDGEEENENNSALEGVVMRRKRQDEEVNGTRKEKEESIDLSDIEDTNQLDVDINKHKSNLSKRGSLALRRKPSRSNRRSLIADAPDNLFKDSTRPRAQSLPNGDGDLLDQRDSDLSPSAKKTPPSFMMPLPGMAVRPPHRSSIGSPDDDTEMKSEPKRTSKPPPGAFRLPAVAPRPSRPKSEISSKEISEPSVYEKPALRSVGRTPISSDRYEKKPSEDSATVSHDVLRSRGPAKSHDLDRKGSEEKDVTFEQPVLKSVSRTNKTEPSGERDFTFEKPRLRSTPKKELEKVGNKSEDIGSFVKPSLRSTPKPSLNTDTQNEDTVKLGSSNYESSILKDTPKRSSYETKSDTEKHTFEKPPLRSSGRMLVNEVIDNSHESVDKYEKQRSGYSTTEQSVNGVSEDAHTFEKPVLRSTPARVQREEKGSFAKPTLRKSPEKQLTNDTLSENKGYFDKPSLRKTENSLSEEKTHISSSGKDYTSKFPEMKLRKAGIPGAGDKEKAAEKPEWLQTAKTKQTKALGAIQSQENFKNHYLGKSEKSTPSWLESQSTSQVPLQEISQNQTGSISSELSSSQSSLSEEKKSLLIESRTRTSSSGSTDSDSSKRKTGHNNYSPSWMKQLTPAKSTPTLPTTEEVPQWKKDLLQRNKNRKNSLGETPQKKDESPEPEWKGNVQLRKVRQTPGPVKDAGPTEPEWKKAAEERKARLRRSVLNEPNDSSLVSEASQERLEDNLC